MRTLVVIGMLVCGGSLLACSVPDVIFASNDAGVDDVDSGDDGSREASPGTYPGQDAMAPAPMTPAASAASAAPMPAAPTCPSHPPMGAQGCCGSTPCVGPGCTMQCPACAACAGQVCCVSQGQGGPGQGDGNGQTHMGVSVSCALTAKSCGGS